MRSDMSQSTAEANSSGCAMGACFKRSLPIAQNPFGRGRKVSVMASHRGNSLPFGERGFGQRRRTVQRQGAGRALVGRVESLAVLKIDIEQRRLGATDPAIGFQREHVALTWSSVLASINHSSKASPSCDWRLPLRSVWPSAMRKFASMSLPRSSSVFSETRLLLLWIDIDTSGMSVNT